MTLAGALAGRPDAAQTSDPTHRALIYANCEVESALPVLKLIPRDRSGWSSEPTDASHSRLLLATTRRQTKRIDCSQQSVRPEPQTRRLTRPGS